MPNFHPGIQRAKVDIEIIGIWLIHRKIIHKSIKYRVNHKIIHIIHRFAVISYVNRPLSSRTFILWIFPSDIMSYPEYRILRQHSLHFQNTHRLQLTLHIRCRTAAKTRRAAVPGSPMRSYLLFYHLLSGLPFPSVLMLPVSRRMNSTNAQIPTAMPESPRVKMVIRPMAS